MDISDETAWQAEDLKILYIVLQESIAKLEQISVKIAKSIFV